MWFIPIKRRSARKRPVKIARFVTHTVFLFLVAGCVLVVVGETAYLSQLLPGWVPVGSPLHTMVRSIGAALIGSGVFTAIIKSNEYSAIFAAIIGEIIWSKAFIARRSDKEEIWSLVSRSIYQEKFPAISDEIEKIITSKYFPTEHAYYIDGYDFILNISEVNAQFRQQNETIKATIIPSSPQTKFEYRIGSSIIQPEHSENDLSEIVLESITVNGEEHELSLLHPYKNANNELVMEYALLLQGAPEYRVVIRKKKICHKKANPIKRFTYTSIMRNTTFTVLAAATQQFIFYGLGTVEDFKQLEEYENNGIKLSSWSYTGILLPHQGFFVIFK